MILKYIVFFILFLIFIYMVVWSVKLVKHGDRKKKIGRLNELQKKRDEKKHKAKKEAAVNSDSKADTNADAESYNEALNEVGGLEDEAPKITRDYWVNLREIEGMSEEEAQKYYHYFRGAKEAVPQLIVEMYDCGIVRTDELERVAYGTDKMENVDLSFLDHIDDEDVISVDSGIKVDALQSAAKELSEDDPVITDINGTLSMGVSGVIDAVDIENSNKGMLDEPITYKKEVSVEQAQYDRALTSTPEIRKNIFECWTRYVNDMYAQVYIEAKEDTVYRIHKMLLDYGNNDVDVLLESPY